MKAQFHAYRFRGMIIDHGHISMFISNEGEFRGFMEPCRTRTRNRGPAKP
jgi:hypothetical protein